MRSISKGEWNEGQRIALATSLVDDLQGVCFHLSKTSGHLDVQVRSHTLVACELSLSRYLNQWNTRSFLLHPIH